MIDVRTHTKKRKKTTKILGEEEKNFFIANIMNVGEKNGGRKKGVYKRCRRFGCV